MASDPVFVASTGWRDRTLQVFNATTKQTRTVQYGDTDYPHQCAFDRSGKILAVAHGPVVDLLDSATLEVKFTLQFPAFSVAFVNQSSTLVCGCDSGEVLLFDTIACKELQRKPVHADRVKSIFISPNDELIVTASADKTVAVSRGDDLTVLARLDHFTYTVNSVLLLPDNDTIVAASDDQTIQVLSAQSKRCLATLTNHNSYVYSLALSPDNKYFASGGYQSVIIWDCATLTAVQSLKFENFVAFLTFGPQSEVLYVGTNYFGVIGVNFLTGERLDRVSRHQRGVEGLSCTGVARQAISNAKPPILGGTLASQTQRMTGGHLITEESQSSLDANLNGAKPSSRQEQVVVLLKELGLEQYGAALLQNGFDSLEILRTATMNDFERIGLKIGHARFLLTAALSRPLAGSTSEQTYLAFLQSTIGSVQQFSKAERREIRAKKAALGINDTTHFRLLQAVGWSQTDFEDGERCL